MALHDEFSQRQASALADRLRREGGAGLPDQIRRGFALAVQRSPNSSELRAARQFIADQTAKARAEGKEVPERVALRSFCLCLLNLNETIYVD